METTIKQTTISTVEVAETENASFDLVVTRVDGSVSKIVANISAQQSQVDEYGMTVHSVENVGSISYNKGTISTAALPANDKLHLIIGEFLQIVDSIKQRKE